MALKNRSRNGVAVSADFEKPSSPPPRKAVPVLKSKSLTCFKFRFLRRPQKASETHQSDFFTAMVNLYGFACSNRLKRFLAMAGNP
jgi:hypothetical protein